MLERLSAPNTRENVGEALAQVHSYINNCGLEDSLIELIYLRVSQINRCAPCIDAQTRELLRTGVSVEKLALVMVWREAASLFSRREQAALIWAESVTSQPDAAIGDQDYAAVTASFSSQEVMDLTVAITLMNTYNRLGIGYRSSPRTIEMHS